MNNLEAVQGIIRHHETLWIERDEDGKIKQVYDVNKNPVDKTKLKLSFMIKVIDGGFTYLDEFISLESIREDSKMISLSRQRRHKWGHVKEYLKYKEKNVE